MELRLTARLFSGRPDPSWVVAGGEARDLLQRLRSLPRKPAAAASPAPGLGYRGVDIAAPGEPAWMAYGGTVNRAGQVFADPGRLIERRALATAHGVLDDELLETILRGIAGNKSG